MGKQLRECDKKENARIAAAECFQAAQKARDNGDERRAARHDAQGKQIAKWGK